MPKVVVTNSKGLVQSAGGGLLASDGGTIWNAGSSQLGPSGLIVGKASNPHNAANPFTEGTSQLWPLGTKLIYGEREFRYAFSNGAVNAGVLLQSAAAVAHHRDCNVASEGAAGAYSVTVTLGATAATKNQYKDGYLAVEIDSADVNSQGQMWKIQSNPAADASATLTLTLYDPLQNALPTTADVSLIQNPYMDVVIAPITHTGAVVGVSTIETADNRYFWAQTGGICSALASGTLLLGGMAVRSDTTAGAVEPLDDSAVAEGITVGQVHMLGGNGTGDNAVIILNLGL